jgi:hypothetical protein
MGTGTFDQVNVGHIGLPLLVVTGTLLVIGSARAIRLRTPFDAAFLAFIPIVAALNPLTLLYPKDAIRSLAVPLALLPAVVLGLRKPSPHESPVAISAAQVDTGTGDENVWAGRGLAAPNGERDSDTSGGPS